MKLFSTMLEGVLRARRLQIASTKKRTRIAQLQSQAENPSVFQDIANLFRKTERQRTLESDLEKAKATQPGIDTAKSSAIAKVDRSIITRFARKDMSSQANSLRTAVGLTNTINRHQEALKTETNPQTIQTLHAKIANAQRNLQRPR